MHTFVKTKDGKIHILYSDNTESCPYFPETMDLIPEYH
jgi:hypothetical protein